MFEFLSRLNPGSDRNGYDLWLLRVHGSIKSPIPEPRLSAQEIYETKIRRGSISARLNLLPNTTHLTWDFHPPDAPLHRK